MNSALAGSLLAEPALLPLMPAASVQTWGSTVVVAPHPDDESLGCGGAIALLRRYGCAVHALMVSDGTRSHPHSANYPAPRLRGVREAEAAQALELLGVPAEAITFLRYGDCAVPFAHDAHFAEAVARCRTLLEAASARTVLVPWRRDPHRDHRATYQIVAAAVQQMSAPPRVLEYPIWVWELAARDDAPAIGEMAGWRLDIADVVAQKQQAIAAHVSQTTDLIDDDPEGFRLQPDVLAHFAVPWETYLETRRETATSHPEHSLGAAYFDAKYRDNPDPWNFETSTYEADKYAATLAALPKRRYRSAFEIGCSVGVLTAQLARHCERLLAVDVSERALERARQRCHNLPQVQFARMTLPQDFPADSFDLIVMSEVGYYLSHNDLDRARQQITRHLHPGGVLVLVHWTPFVDEYPLTGDTVHEAFLADPALLPVHSERHDLYRLDVLERR